MGTVVGGHAGVLIEAIIPDVGADGTLRHEAVAPHRRGGAGVDLERDVRCARVRDDGREVALTAHFGTDIGQHPTSGPRERRKRPLQGLADRWVAGADEAPPQLTALTAPRAEALGGLGRYRIHRDAVAQDLDRLDEGVVNRRDSWPEIAGTTRQPPRHERSAKHPRHPPAEPSRATPDLAGAPHLTLEGLVGTHTLERLVRRSGQVRRGSGRLGWWVAGVLGAALVAGGLARRAGYLGPGVASVHNALVEPIEILSHGVPVDTVAPEATQRLSPRRGQRGELRWRLIRPGNPPIGEPLEGPLPAFPRAGGRVLADVSAEVGGQRYFAPIITNASASDITLEVNPGSAA